MKRNKFATSYGLLVATESGHVVLIERLIPYSIHNYLITRRKKGEEATATLADWEDLERFLTGKCFEDQWDIPHGQLQKKMSPFRSAYQEFVEETGFYFKKYRLLQNQPVQLEFTALDGYDYTQYYYIVMASCVLPSLRPRKDPFDERAFRGRLLTYRDAYEKLVRQQESLGKWDYKHKLIPHFGSIDHRRLAVPSLLNSLHQDIVVRGVRIIFGDLGRCPHLLHYYLDKTCFPFHVSTDHQEEECDFLLVVEPEFGERVRTYPWVKRGVVYVTSHLDLVTGENTAIKMYHFRTALNPSRFKGYVDQPPPEAITWTPQPFLLETKEILGYSVCVDLTPYQNPRETYLSFLNAKTLLSEREEGSWTVAIGKKMLKDIRRRQRCWGTIPQWYKM